jgi:hypothetical protein
VVLRQRHAQEVARTGDDEPVVPAPEAGAGGKR